MKIVLLGSIPKGDDIRENWVDWKIPYIETIKNLLPDAEFIHGDAISDNAGAEMVVGHDLSMIRQADVCVVDAQQKIGAGTAQEMIIAKHFRKPVVSVIPKDTHHRKTNATFHGVKMDEWVHPFLKVSSDYVADSVEDAAKWIHKYSSSPQKLSIKDLKIYDDVIAKYEAER
ncbi:MAG: hypothetical protein U5L95_02070 [Candidatus Saccharibacteria bacterium]|nr:hypothetical protein [Candidatus Saccharibacteria bacterium]